MKGLAMLMALVLGADLAACGAGFDERALPPDRNSVDVKGPNSKENIMTAAPVDPHATPLAPGSPVRSPVLDRALSANNNAAIIMFLLNNPGDPFADQARINLKARRTPDSAAALKAAAGSDAAVVAAFDAARLNGIDADWSRFLADYGSNPLAAEVARFR